MTLPDPAFPPLLSAQAVDRPVDPFTQAARLADRAECGAGDVLWRRSEAIADLAIVLEPDVPLRRAGQILPLSMVAVGEALGVICPPKVSVRYRWPGDIEINGAKAGEVRLAAASCTPDEVPRWLVVGMRLQIFHDDPDREPGEDLSKTCLAEEGVADGWSRSDIIGTIASYWMSGLHNWQEDGFRTCHDKWLFLALGNDEGDPLTVVHEGQRLTGRVLGLDEDAGLILKPEGAGQDGQTRVLPLAGHILDLDHLTSGDAS